MSEHKNEREVARAMGLWSKNLSCKGLSRGSHDVFY